MRDGWLNGAGQTYPAVEKFGPAEWIDIARKKSLSLLRVRVNALRWFAKANGFLASEDKNDLGLENLHERLKDGKIDPYAAAKKMVDLLEKERSSSTASTYRTAIQTFYRYTDIPFKEELFDERVPIPIATRSNRPGTLSKEQLHTLLVSLDLPYRALVEFLVNTGCRVNEPFHVRMKDIAFDKKPARVELDASTEKGRASDSTLRRISFLSSEAIRILREYAKGKNPDDLLFQNLNKDKAYYHLMKAFKKLGLTRREGNLSKFNLNLHSFRFASQDIFREAGLPEPHVQLQIGRDAGVESQHIPVEKRAKAWSEFVEPAMQFMQSEPEKPADFHLLTNDGTYRQKRYKDEHELEELVKSYQREVFGEDFIYFDVKKKVHGKLRPRIPDGILFDLAERPDPRVWIVEYELATHDIEQHVAPQLRGFKGLQSAESRDEILDEIDKELKTDEEKLRKFKQVMGKETEIYRRINGILRQQPRIVVIFDTVNDEIRDKLRESDLPLDYRVLEFRTFEKNGKLAHLFTPFYVSKTIVGGSR